VARGGATSRALPAWAIAARAAWRYTGEERPPFAHTPGPGQRSVWDFPRPPVVECVRDEVRVGAAGFEIARSDRCLRVLETASPPTYYLPPEDVDWQRLAPGRGSSRCEWKGEARYWDLAFESERRDAVAWSYPEPFPDFVRLRRHLSFYPARVECYVGARRASPQPGGFYGGWVTPDLVGPFKGERGVGAL